MQESLVCFKEKDANLKGEDIQEGIAAVISVKLTDAQFEGQTKAALATPPWALYGYGHDG